jgi:hypothetical protein
MRKKQQGDILGISNTPAGTGLPGVTNRGSHPQGIEVGTRATGIGDVPQRSGATGIDMGGGGEGTDVELENTPPRRQPGDGRRDK